MISHEEAVAEETGEEVILIEDRDNRVTSSTSYPAS